MTILFLAIVIATVAVIYFAEVRAAKPVTLRQHIARVARHTMVVCVACFVFLVCRRLLAQGVYPFDDNYIASLATIIVMATYLYRTYETRRWMDLSIRGGALLAAITWGGAWGIYQKCGMGMFCFIPAWLSVMRFADIARSNGYRPPSPREPLRLLSPVHVRGAGFEIAYLAESKELLVSLEDKFSGRWEHGKYLTTDTPGSEIRVPFMVQYDSFSPGERWILNLSWKWLDEENRVYGFATVNSHTAGTSSSAYIDGRIVTAYTPGTTTTSTVHDGTSYMRKTGNFIPKLFLKDEKSRSVELPALSAAERTLVDGVLEEISKQTAAMIAERNAQDVAEEKLRQEKEEILRQEKKEKVIALLREKEQELEQKVYERTQELARRKLLSLTEALEKAGLPSDAAGLFLYHAYDKEGAISELLAADRDGRGAIVASDGTQVWQGSWCGAEATLEADALVLKVDDEAYRQQYLAEHRLQLKLGDKSDRLEWMDRIGILAAK